MFGTPFCGHEFTQDQLAQFEQVICPCGNKYQSKELLEFKRLSQLAAETNQKLSALVQGMASYNNGNKVVAGPTSEPQVAKPAKPKRERPKLSVTQWLIVAAGFMVLVAASVFVSQNLNTWNVYAWSTLELSLGLIAGFGAFKLKRFSILLSNFLAVFSSAMLLTLIMSFSTTFGWGFTAWNAEPGWFWSVNLGTVALVSLLLGIWSKNFGWRAIAPLSLTASAITLVVNSSGTFEDRWRIAVLSIALFAVLISVRLARNAKWVIESGNDEAYLKDLQSREDNSLRRFGVAVSLLLVAYAAIDVLQQLTFEAALPLDGVAALTTAVVWLVGARINRTWVNALVEKDQTILNLRNTASAIGLSFLGLGILSVINGVDFKIGLSVAVALLLLVFTLERFAKFLLLPTVAVTVAGWVTASFGLIWYLKPESDSYLRPLGFYALAIALVLSVREFFEFRPLRTIAIYLSGFIGSVSVFLFYVTKTEEDSIEFAAALALALIGVNLFPALVTWLAVRAKSTISSVADWIPLAQSTVVALLGATAIHYAGAKPFLMTLASGYLSVSLAGMVIFKGKALAQKFSHQGYVAIGLSVIVPVLSFSTEALKVQSAFILLDGLLVLGFALVTKNIRWANVGYAVTSFSLLIANNAWGSQENSAVIASIALGLGALGNVGLIWANRQFGKGGFSTKLVTRISTGISLLLVISSAQRFIPLKPTDYWILVAVPALIALVIELRAKSNFAFIYAGAALLAATANYSNQPELNLNGRLAVAFAVPTFLLIRRSIQKKQLGWSLGAQVTAAALGYFIARIGYNQFNLKWDGPEVYAFIIAILLAATARFTNSANGKLGDYLKLDIPVLVAAVPSLVYAGSYNPDSLAENANRFLAASAIIWIHNVWRTIERNQLGWLIAQAVTGFIFAFALVRDVYINAKLSWDGPELYSLSFLVTVLVGLHLASRQNLLKTSIFRFGLPVAVAITPSVVYSWTSVTKQFSELDLNEITRTLVVLAVAAGALVLGILRGNRGLNLVGTVELWLIAVPGLWFKTSAVDNGSADLELRGLIIAAVIYWAIALVRKYTELKLKSIVFIGIPITIALAPAIFHTISSLGGSEIRSLDWWRFSIVLSVSLILLVVGSLREIGGTFFPGLIGVIVTVLPYGFHPLTNKEWFLWAILLGVAGLLVWLAVRLENMRKAGREPSVWLKELK